MDPMPKATKAIDVPRLRRNSQSLFAHPLNREARRLMRGYEEIDAAEQTFRAAAEAEQLAGRDIEKLNYSKSTLELRDHWHELMSRAAVDCNAIADRIASKRRPSPADCLTLAVASWRSARARSQCAVTVLSAAKIDLASGAGR